MADTDTNAMGCKVDHMRDRYEIVALDDQLEYRYLQKDDGLRPVAEFLNRQILQRAMEQAGLEPLDGEVELYYSLLTDDETLTTDSNKARQKLRETGVDVDQVKADFVSYQTIRKHLNKCMGIDTSAGDSGPDLDTTWDEIKALRERMSTVIKDALARHRNQNRIHIDDPVVTISITIRCQSCHASRDLHEFLTHPSCDCPDDDG